MVNDNLSNSLRLFLAVWGLFLALFTPLLVCLWTSVQEVLFEVSPAGVLMVAAGVFCVCASSACTDSLPVSERKSRVIICCKTCMSLAMIFVFPVSLLAMLVPQSLGNLVSVVILLGTFAWFNLAGNYLIRSMNVPMQLLLLAGGYWVYFMMRQVDYTISGTSADSGKLSYIAASSLITYTGINENLPAVLVLAGCFFCAGLLMLLINRVAD